MTNLSNLADRPRTAAAIVALAAALVYAGTLGHALVWDDANVLAGMREAAARGPGALLGAEFLADTGYHRPVVLLSLRLDDLLGGGAVFVFHLTNVLLHLAASVLTLLLLRAWLRNDAAALAGALVFAVHPAHVESVAFVSGRTDLWVTVLGLAAALAWTWWRRGARRAGPAALLLFLLSLFAKESAYLLPAALLVISALLPQDARDPRPWWRRQAGWLGVAVVTMAVAAALRVGVAGVGFGEGAATAGSRLGADLTTRLGHLPALAAWYLRLLLVPWPLNAYWSVQHLAPGVLTWAAAVTAVGVVALARRGGAAGLAWTFIFLLPVLGFAPLQGAPFAERFLYLPSFGWCLVAGALFARAADAGRRRAATVTAAVVVALLTTATLTRVPVWKDNVTLFDDMARRSPGEYVVQHDLGAALHLAGDRAGSLAAYRRAVALAPTHEPSLRALGVAEGAAGNLDASYDLLRRAVAADPRRPEAHCNFAVIAAHRGELGLAETHYRRALELRPDYALALAGLCETLAARGDADGARRHLAALQRLDPRLAAETQRRLTGTSP
ncbi:MAG: tetratricopeptide repeat protein [Candidatus Latescibacteria bacterium]|nr:tetratricopeptide repeat protein [Candidatus Latescibacterota bacterium]